MAVKDGLTRIFNKRYFSETLEKEFNFNRRNSVGLALVLFYIDHSKQVNDTWGHPVGDFILKNLVELIETEARGYDLFARYGGEEFVFLHRGAPLETAIVLVERVRCEVEAHTFSYDELDLKFTISLGVTWWGGGDSLSGGAEFVEAAQTGIFMTQRRGAAIVSVMIHCLKMVSPESDTC